MYTIEDIDVFIATHNREEMLRETIECLLKQTIHIPQVTVLDNESTDNTEAVVKEYENKGFKYVRTFTRPGNFLKAQELASKEFCIVFHDDNLVHPEFFERILLGLNSIKGVYGITSTYKCIEYKEKSKDKFLATINEILKNYLDKTFLISENWMDFCRNNIHAETYPFPKISPATPALIYKTEILKNRKDMTQIYGKADDLSIYKNILEKGKFVLLRDSNALIIRAHENRDLISDENSLTLEQCINWIKIYTDEMNQHKCEDLWLNFWEMVFFLYPMLVKKSIFEKYYIWNFCQYLIDNECISKEGQYYYEKFIEKYKNGYIQKILNKKISLAQKIFSIKNEHIDTRYRVKVLYILGKKFRLFLKKD